MYFYDIFNNYTGSTIVRLVIWKTFYRWHCDHQLASIFIFKHTNTYNISDQLSVSATPGPQQPFENNIRNREKEKANADTKGPRRQVGWGHKVKDKHPSDTFNCQPSASPLLPLRQKGGEGQQRSAETHCSGAGPVNPQLLGDMNRCVQTSIWCACFVVVAADRYKYAMMLMLSMHQQLALVLRCVTLHHVEHLLSADHWPRKTEGKH